MRKIQIIKGDVVKHEFKSITECLEFFDRTSPNHKWHNASLSKYAKEQIKMAGDYYFKIVDDYTKEQLRNAVMDCRYRWSVSKVYETKLKNIKLFIEYVSLMFDDPDKYRQSIAKIKPITKVGTGMVFVNYHDEIVAFNSKLLAIKRTFKKRRHYRKISTYYTDVVKYGAIVGVGSTKGTVLVEIPKQITLQKIKAGIIKRPKQDKNFFRNIDTF